MTWYLRFNNLQRDSRGDESANRVTSAETLASSSGDAVITLCWPGRFFWWLATEDPVDGWGGKERCTKGFIGGEGIGDFQDAACGAFTIRFSVLVFFQV